MSTVVPKSVQTCSEYVLGRFFRKSFFAQCSMEGRVFENFQKSQKFSKIAKMPEIVPKNVQTCFEHALGRFFRKSFIAQCSLEGRVVEKFQKNQKIFQNCKKAQNRSQKCPNEFWTYFGVIISKIFLPSVPWRVELSKIFKSQKLFKIAKVPKIVPKSVQTCFEHVLG